MVEDAHSAARLPPTKSLVREIEPPKWLGDQAPASPARIAALREHFLAGVISLVPAEAAAVEGQGDSALGRRDMAHHS
jgi:hypothetical protein